MGHAPAVVGHVEGRAGTDSRRSPGRRGRTRATCPSGPGPAPRVTSAMVRSMWHMMVRRRSPPSFRTNSAISMGAPGLRPGWIISGAPGLALGGHRGAHDLLLVVRPRPGAADLADEPRAHAGVADADRHIGDDLAGEVVNGARSPCRRMRRGHVVAGAHDHVEAGAPGDAGQGQGSRPRLRLVGSTTVWPPARLKRRISSSATRSSSSRRLSRLELKFWRTQPRFARLTGSRARPLSLAAAGSTNMTLKSMRRCSWGRVTPVASGAMGPSTVWIWPGDGRDMTTGGLYSAAARPKPSTKEDLDAASAHDHRRALHDLGRPLPGHRGRPRRAAGRRQRGGRRGRRRHRARRRAQRPGVVLGRGAHDHLPGRARRGGDHRRARGMAAGGAPGDVRRGARGHHPARRPPHGGAGGARRVDPRPGALRHHELRRRGRGGHPLRPRRLHHAPRDGALHRPERGDLSPVAAERGHLPARRPAAARGRAVRADRSRAVAPVHGRRGARGEPPRPGRRTGRRARCLLPRRPRRGHGALLPGERRLAHRGGPGLVPVRDRAARCGRRSGAPR